MIKLILKEISEKPLKQIIYFVVSVVFCINLIIVCSEVKESSIEKKGQVILENVLDMYLFIPDENNIYGVNEHESGEDRELVDNIIANRYKDIINNLEQKYSGQTINSSAYWIDGKNNIISCDNELFNIINITYSKGYGFSDNENEVIAIKGNANIGDKINVSNSYGKDIEYIVVGVLDSNVFLKIGYGFNNINNYLDMFDKYNDSVYILNPINSININRKNGISEENILQPVFVKCNNEKGIEYLSQYGYIKELRELQKSEKNIISISLLIISLIILVIVIGIDLCTYVNSEIYILYKNLGMNNKSKILLLVGKNILSILLGIFISILLVGFYKENLLFERLFGFIIIPIYIIVCTFGISMVKDK